ncbi:MAG TPA: hypothetical protein VIK50_01780 [Gemmatimonadaceae bacterium]
MYRALRPWLVLLVAVSCTGERAPGNDTASPEGSPPDGTPRTARTSTWNRAAGAMFAVRSGTGTIAWLVNPAYGDAQALDTLTAVAWNVEGAQLSMIDGAKVVGTGRISGLRYDSTCAGWPTASIVMETGTATEWRLAFPEGSVEGATFDSLPILSAADSAARARAGALAASRLPDDTVAAFRGRPFIVRQASRFSIDADTVGTVFEVVRLVPQEANPLQEQILIITEEGSSRPAATAFHEREIGAEESTGSIELLGVLRVRSSGRLALLVRREREAGFVLEWIERSRDGTWVVRWRSATDSC